jgi:hypothetical protein
MTRRQRWTISAIVAVLVAAGSLPAERPAPVAAPRPAPPVASAEATRPALPEAPARPRSVRASPTFRPVRIAATAAGNELFGVAPIPCPSCVSGSRVQYVGQGHGIVVHLRNIPVAGRHTLVIFYESDGARPLSVVVADHPAVTVTLPGKGSWITPAEARLTIDLPAGASDIKLFHADRPAPDLDQIVVR